MAFTASVTKQLGDLLQEQQEPFVLELYLIDRGYRKNVMLSKRNRIFRRACRSEVLCRRRKIISRCSSAVKALFEILGVKRGSSRKSAEGTFSRKGQHRHGNLLDDDEGDMDRKMKKISEDRMQLSPVSVLEAALSNEESPVHINQTIQNTEILREEVSSDSIYSDSYESLEKYLSGKTSEVSKPNSHSQHTKVTLALLQTKQLLFDCVKEVVETQRLNNKRPCEFREALGAEAFGKSLCENILRWTTQSLNANYSNQLFDRDVLCSAEWNVFEQGKGIIGKEIADCILEDISVDIVMDLIRV
ncbi:uncharacterized protein LOC108226604 isoform X2 [Daucus carota subsp. sativus]|uniref:uncharacterized protein LOC108226604 isoform X2 n=1 Tax=Daucus carota subsp. sativus TaxID=79200 RepID=UPI0007F0400C|nr:PREDICTED: uncharacterized protein LOC108226604 isoform X2 [Daucus carota subsp. sativus]